jgi:rubrerythrin
MQFGKYQTSATQAKMQELPPLAQDFVRELSLQHEWMAKNVVMLMNQLCQERLAKETNYIQ